MIVRTTPSALCLGYAADLELIRLKLLTEGWSRVSVAVGPERNEYPMGVLPQLNNHKDVLRLWIMVCRAINCIPVSAKRRYGASCTWDLINNQIEVSAGSCAALVLNYNSEYDYMSAQHEGTHANP